MHWVVEALGKIARGNDPCNAQAATPTGKTTSAER